MLTEPAGRERLLLHLLLHAAKLVTDRLRREIERIGLRHGQGRILAALARRKNLSQSAIARGLHIRPATVSNMLRRMERSGLIERASDSRDGRIQQVALTRKGKRAQAAVERVWLEVEKDIRAALAGRDIEEARAVLLALRDGFGGKSPEFTKEGSDNEADL